ncbi:MAG: DNA repair protein RecN [Ruminococcus sp.]|nr:DNA repair protein RecN [Ruminococcus sp.]MDY3894710.1 DNA repair protein RecN [Candidatus Fimenecus sp.]
MLSNLQIENIAVIKSASIDFENGFNVMTGETGAGKSIVIDSLNAILGERTSRELIRSGSDSASVCAEFQNIGDNVKNALEKLGIEKDDTLIVSRKLTPDGKNVCRINGMPATVSMLKTLGVQLVNIHGQLDNQSLLSPETHCSFIDKLAGSGRELNAFKELYSLYIKKKNELKSLNTDVNEKNRRLDILNYQIEEIQKADIRPGEKDELTEKLGFLRNAEKVLDLLHTAYAALNGDGETPGAADIAADAASKLLSAAGYSSDFAETANGVNDAAMNLSAYTEELRDKIYSLDYDPAETERAEERLDVIYRLSQKYGDSEEEILAYLENAEKERDALSFSDERAEQLRAETEKAYNEALAAAKKLSEIRIEAGKKFSADVERELAFLDMPSVKFIVNDSVGELYENGIDNIEFLLSANAGEEPKPLSKIASGGELSRIMLAIKCVLSELDDIDTLIFDEIDSGVSGRAALKIAAKMKELSKTHQVICVTHLAQIAAFADEHKLILKEEKDGRTYTCITSLDYDGRKYELARIMGGLTVTQSILNSAEELLSSAEIDD